MARNINSEDFSRMMEYLQQKVRHGVHEIEVESSTKDCVVVFKVETLIAKLNRADSAQINKWFRICENAVHLRVMDFRKGQIAVRQFIAGGDFQNRPMRIGDWRCGEKQKAAEAEGGIHNGNRKGHWFDYSYLNANGDRVRVEVKHAGAWFEPNREGH